MFSAALPSSVALSLCALVAPAYALNAPPIGGGVVGAGKLGGGVVGAGKLGDAVYGGPIAALDGPCTITYSSGRSMRVRSCGTTTATLCCSYDEWTGNSACATSCECERESERDVKVVDAQYPTLLRGVPVLFQFDTKPTADFAPIGCGPVAIAQLMLWFHGLGWTDVARDYEAGGLIDWESLTTDLSSSDYLNTWVRNNASPTLMRRMQNGIIDFLADQGYDSEVAHYEVKDSASGDAISASTAMEHIKGAVQNGRPVVIGYDTDDAAGGGIGGGGDDFGFIDHYGLIVGFDDSVSPAQIIVNVGWGATSSSGAGYTETYDFVIGSGKVHLWTVKLNAEDKAHGTGICPADAWDTLYDPLTMSLTDSDGTSDEYVGVTYTSASYDAYPVLQRFVSGERCDAIGGEVSHTETVPYTYTESASCTRLYGIYAEMEDGTWDPEMEDLSGIPDPLFP